MKAETVTPPAGAYAQRRQRRARLELAELLLYVIQAARRAGESEVDRAALRQYGTLAPKVLGK